MYLKEGMKDAMDYFVEKVNLPLIKTIVMLGNRYPDPTKENTLHPNTHRLLDIRDKFFECWDLPTGDTLIRAMFRIATVKYEHSPTWRDMLDWFLMEVGRSDWKPWNPTRQMKCWKGER